MSTASPDQIAEYIAEYAAEFRAEVKRIGTNVLHPMQENGVGEYYLQNNFLLYLLNDGYAFVDLSDTLLIPHHVYLSAMETNRHELLVRLGHFGKTSFRKEYNLGEYAIRIERKNISVEEFCARLTFGSFIVTPPKDSSYWSDNSITGGVTFSNNHVRRVISYAQWGVHLSKTAWDKKTIQARMPLIVQKSMFSVFAGDTPDYKAKLNSLQNGISALNETLMLRPDADESVLHKILKEHPILLDGYANKIDSKPRLDCPTGEAINGKSRLEPDFIICDASGSYTLVEIERPNKILATKAGQPTASTTQAAFQFSEWRAFLSKYGDRQTPDYPGLSTNARTMLVISRSSQMNLSNSSSIEEYIAMVRNTYNVSDGYTYDMLYARSLNLLCKLEVAAPR